MLTAPAGFAAYEWSNGATTQSITLNATTANITVTVYSSRGCSATSDPISVTANANPTADFNFSVNGPTVNFGNTSTGAATYLWDFGDGETSTAPFLSHTYSSGGSYNVCLTATSSAGCTDTECKAVTGVGVLNPGTKIIDSDILANRTFSNDTIYILQGGCLYVRNNSTLTIEPGTLIRGEAAALIIMRGSKIIADGTPTQPIVFTSNNVPPAIGADCCCWAGPLSMCLAVKR
jgi:PKD repeat protein